MQQENKPVDKMEKDKAPHILNTSSNLLGLCFIVLTSLKVLKLNASTFIDELTTVAIVMFFASSFLSFLSIRSFNKKLITKYERAADIIFLFGLLFLFVTTMFIAFGIMN